MKVSAFIPLVLSSTALAASRRSHDALSARQAQLKRGLVDVCVGLDLDVTLLNILPGGKPLVAGHVDLCLCLSILPDFMKSNSVAQNVVKLIGEDPAHNLFANLINSQPNKKQCHYPDHCEPICRFDKPCHFTCKDGFVPDNAENPTKCICPLPHTVCNGKCGDFSNGCTSQVVKTKRTPTCSGQRTPCGVAGGSKGKAYDCVDTQNDLESCGGCTAPSPFDIATPKGKDCSSITGVANVGCSVGVCVVSSCKDGYSVSSQGDSCVANSPWTQNALLILLRKGLIIGVGSLAELEARLGLALKIFRRGNVDVHDVYDLLDLCLKQGLIAAIPDVAWIEEFLIASVHIGRGLEDSSWVDSIIAILLEQKLIIGVYDLVGVKDRLGLIGHIGRRDQYDDLLSLLVAQGLLAKVDDLAAVKDILIAGLTIA